MCVCRFCVAVCLTALSGCTTVFLAWFDPFFTLRPHYTRCVLGQGEIAYNCATCQVDPTCVQCQQCFQLANHEGHDVSFHRTSLGGCCDCGDVEAWAEEGFCPRHRRATAESSAEVLAGLPPAMMAACASDLFPQALAFVANVAQDITSAYLPPTVPQPGVLYSVVIHNDDVHTYDDVRKVSTLARFPCL
jgi:hypothetical protein